MARSRRHPWLLAATGALVLPLLIVSAPANADSVTVPPGTIFYNAVSGEAYAGYPAVFDGGSTAPDGSRSQRIMLTYNAKQDLPGQKGSKVKQSTNGGVSWADYPSFDGTIGAANMVRLPISSGGVISINFEDLSVTETCTDLPVCRRKFNRWMMTPTTFVDAGTATVNFTPGKEIAWARFGQGPIVLDDGKTMLSAMYGVRTGTWQAFTTVVRSTDLGITWTEVAELAAGPGWNEASLSRTSDGGLIAVLRKDENLRGVVPANIALYTRRAPTQSGTGWGAPVRLSSEGGNSPSVELMGNGALVLASGRPDSLLRFSYDGTGTTWTAPAVAYQNYPRTGGQPDGWHEGGGAADRPMRHLGSSGTVGIMPLGGTRLLAVGDNCASGWGCPADTGGYDVGRQNALWKSWVTVSVGDWGRLDLTTMFRNGQLTVQDRQLVRYGNCPGNLAGCRHSLDAYAFDGDARPDSSLVTATRSVTLRLPGPTTIAALGVHAHLLGGNDLRIETSTNGTTWTTPARGARDGIVRPFTAPVQAQYVRLTDPNPLTDPTAAFLHEVEIYTP